MYFIFKQTKKKELHRCNHTIPSEVFVFSPPPSLRNLLSQCGYTFFDGGDGVLA